MGRRGNRLGSQINSNKNIVQNVTGGTDGGLVTVDLVDTQDSATLAVPDDVQRGCKIYKVWFEFWYAASAEVAVGVTNVMTAYIIKNPGTNLTVPDATTYGVSNEKKFVFKTWKGLIGPRTQGFQPYSWKGWIKIPRVYQRFGANDKLQFVFRGDGVASIVCSLAIYKWYI